MKKLHLTFLSGEQVFGDKALDIIKKYGTKAAITDFSILLGKYVSGDFYTNEGNTGKDRTGYYHTKTADKHSNVVCVDSDGDRNYSYATSDSSCRPVLPYSSIKPNCSNVVIDKFVIKEVEYGEYPQTIVDESYSMELETALNSGNIKVTGKTYTTYSLDLYSENRYSENRRKLKTYQEFEYKGKKYIRMIGDFDNDRHILSDGRKVKMGEPYWVAVEPIKWLIDEQADIALSKKIIFSGVQFQNTGNYTGDFAKTNIKQYMDKYLSKEIIPSKNAIYLSNMSSDDKELALLSIGQILDNGIEAQLEVLNKYGPKAKETDLAKLTGSVSERSILDYDDPNEERACYQWTSTNTREGNVRIITYDGDERESYSQERCIVIRPTLQSFAIFSKLYSSRVKGDKGTYEAEYGEYPQYAASKELQQVLNKELENYSSGFRLVRNRANCKLKKTGRTYTFDSRGPLEPQNDREKFSPVVYDEYEYKGKKYIRVKMNYGGSDDVELSNGCKYSDGDYVWVEVSPVKWLIDEKTKTLVSKYGLLSGIRYDRYRYNGNFEQTEMYKYLNKYMVHDLFQGIQPVMRIETIVEEPEQEVEPEVVESLEPIEQPIIEEPHRSIFDLFRRKNKVNPNYVSVLKSELDTLSYDILFNVPDGPEKDNLSARFDWVMDYYNNNFTRLNDDKQDLEDLLFREKLNELTLDVKLSIEKSNENIQKRI